jgi:hypothetical protein
MKSGIGCFTFSLVLLIVTCCSPSKNVTTRTTVDRDRNTIEAAAAAEGRDGSTFEKGIIVNSIAEEYQWLRTKYPGSKVEGQALFREKGKPYDVITFVTDEGETKKAYFDISKFFGKGF